MANLLTSILGGVGTIAKGVGSAVGGVGKGFLGGAGEASGLGSIFKAAPTEFAKNVTARGVGSLYNIPGQGSTPSIWNKIGSKLAEQAMSGGGSAPSSPSLPSIEGSTSVSQSKGYQPPQKKQAELERLLRELARR